MLRLEIDEEGSLHFYMLTVNPNIKANPHLANSCSDSELKSRAHLIDAKTYQEFFYFLACNYGTVKTDYE